MTDGTYLGDKNEKENIFNSIKTMWLSTREPKPDLLDPDPQSGLNVVSRELQTSRRLRAFHYWIGSRPLSHAPWLGSGSRSCGGKRVFESGSQIRIGSRSKVPCGEPQYVYRVSPKYRYKS